VTKVLSYVSIFFLWINPQATAYAQSQNMGSSNICGTLVIGDHSIIECNVNTWPLSIEKKGELAQLCQDQNFGAIPPILFMSKRNYNVGEIISIKYSGACPNQTEFLIVPEKTRLSPTRNGGMKGRSVPVPSYAGEIRFIDDRQSRPGMYVIQAYFTDSQRRTFLGGRSLPFQVNSRY
jgi:hypothetical protein